MTRHHCYGPCFFHMNSVMMKWNRCFRKSYCCLLQHEQWNHYSSSAELYSWHNVLVQVLFSWHSQNPDCQMVRCDSSLQRMHFCCSRGQWHWLLHHYSSCLALHVVILGLHVDFLVLTLLSEAVWKLVCASALGSLVFLSLCSLPLFTVAAVAPRPGVSNWFPSRP